MIRNPEPRYHNLYLMPDQYSHLKSLLRGNETYEVDINELFSYITTSDCNFKEEDVIGIYEDLDFTDIPNFIIYVNPDSWAIERLTFQRYREYREKGIYYLPYPLCNKNILEVEDIYRFPFIKSKKEKL